ncbi:hypothetical protein Glove_514g5 [Diversispora epigaea]|uniref:Uncharacterized protein n=1 Tax=Diversispora epigaea TaxID=1348612 RepID=A0A397GJ62_9GLOM|nr:hypothetical protein Glove_514g5 [Diversispora epigaea]
MILRAITATNALESFYSELKRTTSFLHDLIGTSHKIVIIDQKKRADSENTVFNFRTKKISVYGVDNEILEKIHKFPFPIQQILIKEVGRNWVFWHSTSQLVIFHASKTSSNISFFVHRFNVLSSPEHNSLYHTIYVIQLAIKKVQEKR